MIRMIQSKSAGHAKAYYSEALLKSDYYIDGQELNGTFSGRLSKRLDITGPVTRAAFFALCENRHPLTDQPLTPRTKKDRTVGYDINFHVPKSVSILHALAKDDHILAAFRECVAASMQDIEAQAKARVRRDGVYADRVTGELLWVDFIHQTARPVDGYVPDPHLHAHCYVFNMTWDEQEQQLKAGQFRDINKEMPYFQALFHKKLADKLAGLGYGVRPTEKSFEVEGVPQEIIELFSKRTDQIGRVAKEKGITDAGELGALGARTRAKKQSGLGMEELKAAWKAQVKLQDAARNNPDNLPVRFAMQPGEPVKQRQLTARQCRDYALSHCLERASVVPYSKLAATALKHGIGSTADAASILQELESCPDLVRIQEGSRTLCTTKEVLQEEQRMVSLARAGKNGLVPLYDTLPEVKAPGQQGDAIRHILGTGDMVSIVRGAAGAGKTTLMKEAVRHIEQAGKKVTVIAPTARASRGVLREEGFSKAETVAGFLNNDSLQQDIAGQVIWVDEAGMLGTGDMAKLLEITSRLKARLILGGDTRQHASVVRGDALRILNTVAGIRSAEVDKIYRQKEQVYRSAVADLSKGNILQGFEKLEAIGAVKESGDNYRQLLEDYMAAVKAGKEVLVISPTHEQGATVTAALRQKLQEAGYIGKREMEIDQLKNLNMSAAQKTDGRNLQKGFVLQFNQNRKGIRRGSRWEVAEPGEQAVSLKNAAGQTVKMELDKTEQFDVFRHSVMAVAKGDKMQITRNGFDRTGNRLDNGLVLEVIAATRKNGVLLQNPQSKMVYSIGADFGNIAHAHCITSHAAQGKTVDEIFIAQPAATFPATNAKQFYVSVSRAREKVHIYTDDKETLLLRAAEAGDRRGALELVQPVEGLHLQHVLIQQREPGKNIDVLPGMSGLTPAYPGNTELTPEDYEPGI
jgi:conjugative relaxase-like TrwC/TraI family protein